MTGIGDSSTDTLYRETILEEYKHPRNHGRFEGADAEATCRNPVCGDEITITLMISHGTVSDVRFEGEGCAISQASASLFTEHIKGRSVADIEAMDEETIISLLGIRPNPMRMKCAVLVLRTVRESLEVRR